MDEELRGIGRVARESGLSVSALRFYDRAGVLVPASVDPRSGYRYYAPEQVAVARLVATLRRVGMPLAGIRVVLASRHDPAAVDALLAAHLGRLEQGLADARRALAAVPALLAAEAAGSTTVRVRRADLVCALDAVRFAVGDDPALPVLGGVLFDVHDEVLTLVATDRYRLAVAPAPLRERAGRPVAALVPAPLADRIAAIPGAELTLQIRAASVSAWSGTDLVEGDLLPDAFPDYRRLLPAGGRPIPVGPAFRSALGVAGDEAALLGVEDGELTAAAADGIAVDREFLLQALDAGGPGQLELLLDGPLTPLVVRSPRSTSLLMPVRR